MSRNYSQSRHDWALELQKRFAKGLYAGHFDVPTSDIKEPDAQENDLAQALDYQGIDKIIQVNGSSRYMAQRYRRQPKNDDYDADDVDFSLRSKSGPGEQCEYTTLKAKYNDEFGNLPAYYAHGVVHDDDTQFEEKGHEWGFRKFRILDGVRTLEAIFEGEVPLIWEKTNTDRVTAAKYYSFDDLHDAGCVIDDFALYELQNLGGSDLPDHLAEFVHGGNFE